VEQESKRTEEALKARFRSIEVLKDLLTRHPDDAEGQRWLATSEKRLAYVYITQTHDFAAAAQALRTAMQIDRQRLAHDPGNAVIKLDLALGQAYIAGLLSRRVDLEGARQMHDSVIALRSDILRVDPHNARVRYLLITDHARLGAVLRDMGRSAEARIIFAQGFQLVKDGDPAAMQSPDMQHAAEDLRKES